MATEQISGSLPVRTTTRALTHPLAPLTTSEIESSRDLIKSLYPVTTSLLYKQITLQEPEKVELAPYLDAEFQGRPKGRIDRRAFVTYYIRNTVRLSNPLEEDRMIDHFTGQVSRSNCQSDS